MRTPIFHAGWWVTCLAAALGACSASEDTQDTARGGARAFGGGPGTGGAPAADEAEIRLMLSEVEDLDATTLPARYPTSFDSELGYEPASAEWLDRIQASSLALDADELSRLSRTGFVISDRLRFPEYVYGYKTVYFEHLPLFVSADSILYAVHRSYESLFSDVEVTALSPLLGRVLRSLRTRLPAAGFSASVQHDLGLYLAVAEGLLSLDAPGLDAEAKAIIGLAEAGKGVQMLTLFGSTREEDFSQFTPRGRYVGGLVRYFRTMIWLGRVDFRLLETQPDHGRVLRRAAVEAAVALRELSSADDRAALEAIDRVITAFVGEADYMAPPQIDGLLAALRVSDSAGLAARTDAEIEEAIIARGYGEQRIASHLLVNGLEATQPNSASFAIIGQRYVIDSHVFSNVTYSRVLARRMMPNPLDVAFAVLQNNQAATLLSPELEEYGYGGQLAQARVLADIHPETFWSASLYNLWLDALRRLSPAASEGLPAVAKSEAWGRRLLNTQLASWSELRHDTLLYAKQSYTGIPVCEFPDAYVEPYPEFFGRLVRFAEQGRLALTALEGSGYSATGALAYLDDVARVTGKLRGMAEHQRSGAPHSAEEIAFINQAVRVENAEVGCTTVPRPQGWYAELFFDQDAALEADPVIADVHTQPSDAAGNTVGKVLHVATGYPRLMVMTVDSCNGPRAYAGLVSSYFEQVTSNFERLNDEGWSQTVAAGSPSDVPWMADVVAR